MSLTSAHLWLAPPNPGSHSILGKSNPYIVRGQ
jgi:hypothetical protein